MKMKNQKVTFKKLSAWFYYKLFLILRWIRKKAEYIEKYMKEKYEAKQEIVTNEILKNGARQKGRDRSGNVEKLMEEGSTTSVGQKNGDCTIKHQFVYNCIVSDEKNCARRRRVTAPRQSSDNNYNLSCEKITLHSYPFKGKYSNDRSERAIDCSTVEGYQHLESGFMDHLFGENKICSNENNNYTTDEDAFNCILKDFKNKIAWIYGLKFGKYVIIIEQLIDELANNSLIEEMTDKETGGTSNKLRLSVVTSDMFEEAMRASQISMIELTYTNVFPSDCRMFIGIPIYKDGYIHRKDQL